MPKRPNRKNIDRNAPLALEVAARLAFPDRTITATDLRIESARGRLTIEKISDKEFTTLECVDRMRGLCRKAATEIEHPDRRPAIRKRQDVTANARLASRDQAAGYCCLSPSTFSTWVKSGRLPPPITGTLRWDLKAIDRALDGLSGLSGATSHETNGAALDEWRMNRARRSKGNS